MRQRRPVRCKIRVRPQGHSKKPSHGRNPCRHQDRAAFQRKGIGKKAIKLLMKKNPRSRYLANVAPNNKKHQEFFKKLGFNGLQYTYEIINPEIV